MKALSSLLIKGYSDSFAISLICHLVAQHLDDHCALPWYSRVPSASNLSDFPSRKIQHRYLKDTKCIPEGEVAEVFDTSLKYVESHLNMGGGRGLTRPSESPTRVRKKEIAVLLCLVGCAFVLDSFGGGFLFLVLRCIATFAFATKQLL